MALAVSPKPDQGLPAAEVRLGEVGAQVDGGVEGLQRVGVPAGVVLHLAQRVQQVVVVRLEARGLLVLLDGVVVVLGVLVDLAEGGVGQPEAGVLARRAGGGVHGGLDVGRVVRVLVEPGLAGVGERLGVVRVQGQHLLEELAGRGVLAVVELLHALGHQGVDLLQALPLLGAGVLRHLLGLATTTVVFSCGDPLLQRAAQLLQARLQLRLLLLQRWPAPAAWTSSSAAFLRRMISSRRAWASESLGSFSSSLSSSSMARSYSCRSM